MKQVLIHAVLACLLLSAVAGDDQKSEEPQELTRLRQAYQREVQAALKPIRTRYADNLAALIRTLSSRGDAKDTLVVAEEMKQIQEDQVLEVRVFTILSARYGVPGAEVDVTAQIKKLVLRKRLSIRAGLGNMDFLPDSAMGRIKTLTVEYTNGVGEKRSVSKMQGEELSIP